MQTNSIIKRKKRLLVISPTAFEEILRNAFSSLYSDVEIINRPKPVAHSPDPFGVGSIIKQSDQLPDAILLVAPSNRSPAKLIPYPLIGGVPVGIVQPNSKEVLEKWLNAIFNNVKKPQQTLWAILSMQKKAYLAGANKMLEGIRLGMYHNGMQLEDWFADKMYRDELCKKLAKGPTLAIYFGHARPRGWSGYRAVRWPHIVAEELQRPCDVLISISCSTLKKQHQRPSFGVKWINEGRACSFLGNVNSAKHNDNNALAHEMMYIFQNEKVDDIGQLLQSVERKILDLSNKKEAFRAFKIYRLIGNPLQSIR